MTTIDLFSGCGGMSLGFQKANFNIVAAYDSWEIAVKTYNENLDHPCFKCDLSGVFDLSDFEEYKPEVIIGGPPCQDFSSAGKRDEELGRADLTLSFAEIVIQLSPQIFVMENVERIKKSSRLQRIKDSFKKADYGLSERVINASYCGVPQARKRYFLIGMKGETDGFLEFYLDKNLNKESLNVSEYFGSELDIEYYYRHPRSYQRRGIFSVHEPSATIRGVNRPLPSTYKCHPGDVTKDLSQVRPLTTEERARVQTFPKDFKFSGSKSQKEQLIGNAVPVELAAYIGNCIQEYLLDKKNGNVKKPSEQTLLFDENSD